MSWVKLRDNWIESERVEDIGPEALALHISALSYSARNETNGRVPRRALRRLYPVDDIDITVKLLVASELWHAVDDDFEIDDWREHLLSSAEMQKRREQSAASSERYRRHKLGDHSMCDFCSAKRKTRDDITDDAGTDGSSDGPRLASSRFASSRSVAVAEERDEDGRASSATAPHARPLRASAGRLRQLDAAMLDELPWHDVGTGCPHDADGWVWVDETKTRLEGVRCDKCMQLVRNTRNRASSLAHTYLGGFDDSAVWLALFDHDAASTSAALCIASLICTHVDGVQTAERVDAVAAEIIRHHPDQPLHAVHSIFERKAP